MLDYLVIAFFAFIGGTARYWLGVWIPAVSGFPLGTLLVNLLGCFIFSWLVKHILSWRWFLRSLNDLFILCFRYNEISAIRSNWLGVYLFIAIVFRWPSHDCTR